MNDNKYLVLHSGGSESGWTMHVNANFGRGLLTLDNARTIAEGLVNKNPALKALIVEAAYIVQTEYPPVRIRRFK